MSWWRGLPSSGIRAVPAPGSTPCGRRLTPAPERDALKAAAAQRAVELVRDGMLVGLGTGTTASHFLTQLGWRVEGGLRIEAVATSDATSRRAAELGIPLRSRLERPLDLAVDGADEIASDRSLIKGRGGALFREKLVAVNSARFVVIADDSKLVTGLGRGVLPVEVLPFLWEQTADRLGQLGCTWRLRGGDAPFVTDNGNLILDLTFPDGIASPASLGQTIKTVVGVVEHGLYIGLATACIVAGPEGVQILGSLD